MRSQHIRFLANSIFIHQHTHTNTESPVQVFELQHIRESENWRLATAHTQFGNSRRENLFKVKSRTEQMITFVFDSFCSWNMGLAWWVFPKLSLSLSLPLTIADDGIIPSGGQRKTPRRFNALEIVIWAIPDGKRKWMPTLCVQTRNTTNRDDDDVDNRKNIYYILLQLFCVRIHRECSCQICVCYTSNSLNSHISPYEEIEEIWAHLIKSSRWWCHRVDNPVIIHLNRSTKCRNKNTKNIVPLKNNYKININIQRNDPFEFFRCIKWDWTFGCTRYGVFVENVEMNSILHEHICIWDRTLSSDVWPLFVASQRWPASFRFNMCCVRCSNVSSEKCLAVTERKFGHTEI